VARVATRQHGVVSRRQLLEAGLTTRAVESWLRGRRLHRVHRGVYALGHARLTFRGWLWAAVHACGGPEAAVISHRSAAAVWDLLPIPSGAVDVTTLRESRPAAGLRVHRSLSLDAKRDRTVHDEDALPTTTVARTLVDLAATLTAHRLERVCHQAQILRLLDVNDIEPLLAGSKGAPKLRQALATLADAEPAITRSELEDRFVALVAQANLPRPLVNVQLHGHEVDFLWPDRHLVAETDGRATHLTPTAFETDRRRDAQLLVAGYRVVRFSYREVAVEPHAVASTLRSLLA
jgi:hypothetical protein